MDDRIGRSAAAPSGARVFSREILCKTDNAGNTLAQRGWLDERTRGQGRNKGD